ncbi:hypothetical protein ACQKKK_05055 [Peribacillus sp. NPDC006672]|uniref:hypothetical protein n=1 Tax=Peribacillus sp. NPDC006672 TaxID=3390606 RepID=UPI003D0035F4
MILRFHIKSNIYCSGEMLIFAINNKENLRETNSGGIDKQGNGIHVVTTLAGSALVAWNSGKGDTVEVTISLGLPIEEDKQASEGKN